MISYKFYKQVVLYTYLEQILVFQNILSVSVGASPNVKQAKEFLQFSFFFVRKSPFTTCLSQWNVNVLNGKFSEWHVNAYRAFFSESRWNNNFNVSVYLSIPVRNYIS